ncbi:hypothetical protein ACFZ8E_04950 [Methylobacterium sp. HMF5984]|uniref:hypothetical protein n=1 Tax=Methylobacterium sp. HMF5984 TaxID=3367370 RepID=UPI00385277E0
MTHDVAREHGGDEVVKQMQIRSADRAARDFDDQIAIRFDLRIGDAVAANVFFPVPDEGSHGSLPCKCYGVKV